MRDAFAVLFFVSVGMLLDPGALLRVAGAGARRAGDRPGRQAAGRARDRVGARAIRSGRRWPWRSRWRRSASSRSSWRRWAASWASSRTEATNALVAASIVSIVLNPLLYRVIRPLERWLVARPALWACLNREPSVPRSADVPQRPRLADPDHRAVVIGYGPTGRTVVRLLRDNGIAPTVVELNIDAVRELRADGVDAVYGDATRPDTLEAAGVPTAGSLILGIRGDGQQRGSDPDGAAMNPAVRVLARAAYLRDVPALKAAGADRVYSGEGEVGARLRRGPARQPRRHARANRSRACAGPRGAGRAAGVMSVRRWSRPHRGVGGRHEGRGTSTRRRRRGPPGSRWGCRR